MTHLSVHLPVGVLLQDFCPSVSVPDWSQLPCSPALHKRQRQHETRLWPRGTGGEGWGGGGMGRIKGGGKCEGVGEEGGAVGGVRRSLERCRYEAALERRTPLMKSYRRQQNQTRVYRNNELFTDTIGAKKRSSLDRQRKLYPEPFSQQQVRSSAGQSQGGGGQEPFPRVQFEVYLYRAQNAYMYTIFSLFPETKTSTSKERRIFIRHGDRHGTTAKQRCKQDAEK